MANHYFRTPACSLMKSLVSYIYRIYIWKVDNVLTILKETKSCGLPAVLLKGWCRRVSLISRQPMYSLKSIWNPSYGYHGHKMILTDSRKITSEGSYSKNSKQTIPFVLCNQIFTNAIHGKRLMTQTPSHLSDAFSCQVDTCRLKAWLVYVIPIMMFAFLHISV